MGDILKFPSRQAQGLTFLERQLRALLAAKGADEQLIDFTVTQLTGIYRDLRESEQCSFSLELPDSISPTDKDTLYRQINAGLGAIHKENHALMIRLVAQLVLTEVRLFQHERTE